MSKLACYALLAIALLAGGFGAGWHAKGVSVDAAEVKADRVQHNADVQDVTQQIDATTAKLQAQQDATATLTADQQLIRTAGDSLHLEITHAAFTPVPTVDVVSACADPTGSPEFERLYAAAAKGADAAHPGAASSSGVP